MILDLGMSLKVLVYKRDMKPHSFIFCVFPVYIKMNYPIISQITQG